MMFEQIDVISVELNLLDILFPWLGVRHFALRRVANYSGKFLPLSWRRNERKRLSLNRVYIIVWFPKWMQRPWNITHWICSFSIRSRRHFVFVKAAATHYPSLPRNISDKETSNRCMHEEMDWICYICVGLPLATKLRGIRVTLR
jgi:hypothetical protein